MRRHAYVNNRYLVLAARTDWVPIVRSRHPVVNDSSRHFSLLAPLVPHSTLREPIHRRFGVTGGQLGCVVDVRMRFICPEKSRKEKTRFSRSAHDGCFESARTQHLRSLPRSTPNW